ncbi:response regulator [Massilia sp. G4R7]|uniref:Response regulator n=1 Tax=Massilia phyllostachyos TaxID=2898585 RepID=A0ABS8QCE3_9BURK|nr:response regulator [Massilia phyllostachyos]MCD2518677.1 response regulator [Massilia phyllostachyos]
MLLDAYGYQPLVEFAPLAALERARRERPRACVLDIGLPEMDGRELARRLRADPATAGAMLVAVTGYGQDSDRQQIMAAGFDHHLVKPVDLGQLERILATVA